MFNKIKKRNDHRKIFFDREFESFFRFINKYSTRQFAVMAVIVATAVICTFEGFEYIYRQSVITRQTAVIQNEAVLIAAEYSNYESLEAAEKLAADGIDAKVINIHTIKPLDEELVVAAAKETGKVVTVEEHSVIGGLGSAVCDVLSEKAPTQVMKIGVNDTFGESGPALELLKKYGLDTDSIYEKIKAFAK